MTTVRYQNSKENRRHLRATLYPEKHRLLNSSYRDNNDHKDLAGEGHNGTSCSEPEFTSSPSVRHLLKSSISSN